MWMIIVPVVATVLLVYIVHTLFTSDGSALADTSFEAFVDNTPSTVDSSKLDRKTPIKHSFNRRYDVPGKQLLILYGTEYGFSEQLAQELCERLIGDSSHSTHSECNWQPRILNAKDYHRVDFAQESVLLVIISTAGDGVPPTDARDFVASLEQSSSELSHLYYSVLALGDSNYIHYCRAGKMVDARLAESKANQLTARRDVDAEDRENIMDWFEKVLKSLEGLDVEEKLDYLEPVDDEAGATNTYNRLRPFIATLKMKYSLTQTTGDDDKETIHCEFDLFGSNLTWTVGDALGIYPQNSSLDVDNFLSASGLSEMAMVRLPNWAYKPQSDDVIPLRSALQLFYNLKSVKAEMLKLLQQHCKDAACVEILDSLLQDGLFKSNTRLQEYLCNREAVDVLRDFKATELRLSAESLLAQLTALTPRYYSISSTPLLDPTTSCVTAAVVRYETLGQQRSGVTTTYLQDRMHVGTVNDKCAVFMSSNPDFRLPANTGASIIMIGPGTGIAPFRAFIQERILTKASGINLLYFGCRRKNQDFLYKNELERWVTEGCLQLRVAFSRDQPQKIYVQDLLREDSTLVWSLLQSGTHVYVCGDARSMAHDVHRALVDIVCVGAQATTAKAEMYMTQLETAQRYQKDCWIT